MCGFTTTRDKASAMVIKQRGEVLIVPLDRRERKLSATCILQEKERSARGESLGKSDAETPYREVGKPTPVFVESA